MARCLRRQFNGEEVEGALLRHLACLTRNTVRLGRGHSTTLFPAPTPLQRRAFDLLAIKLST